MGQMAMAIGSTSIWDNQRLFPERMDNTDDDILNESINRWSERTTCSNVASIHARWPPERDDYSYDMVDDNSIRIKLESEDDNYSIYSDYERKPPARPHQIPTTIGIKQEMSESNEVDLDIRHDMEHVCKQE